MKFKFAALPVLFLLSTGSASAADILKQKNWSCAIETSEADETDELKWVPQKEQKHMSIYEAKLKTMNVKVEIQAVNELSLHPGVYINLTDLASGVTATGYFVPELPRIDRPSPSVRLIPNASGGKFAQAYCYQD